MGYISAVGGNPVQPNQLGYAAITLSATTAFSWPFANQNNPNSVASSMDVTATNTGFLFELPDATQVSPGTTMIFNNIGSNSFTVANISGGTIQTITSGQAYLILLNNNSTQNGTWTIIALGLGTSSPSASALAGLGLLAITTTLNQSHPVTSHAGSYELIASDRAQTNINTGGTVAWTTDTAANLSTNGNNWFSLVKNGGTGTLTITPGSGTIDGQATQILNGNDSCIIVCDGTNFWTIGLGRSLVFPITRISLSVAGNSNVTLTGVQAAYNIIEFTGLLTGNIQVIVPLAVNDWIMYNNTTGNFTLTVITATGTGIVLTQGQRFTLECDGSNVVKTVNPSMNSTLFINTGANTFTTPTDITTSTQFKLTVTGGGGGGASVDGGGGGGAGGTVVAWISGLTPNTAYTATVGAGGAAATTGSNSTFVFGANTIAGNAGVGATTTAGGTGGGTGAGGALVSYSIRNPGWNGIAGTFGGKGGDTPWGEGSPIKTTAGNGNTSLNFGCGGGGALGANTGGAGSSGAILIEWAS